MTDKYFMVGRKSSQDRTGQPHGAGLALASPGGWWDELLPLPRDGRIEMLVGEASSQRENGSEPLSHCLARV